MKNGKWFYTVVRENVLRKENLNSFQFYSYSKSFSAPLRSSLSAAYSVNDYYLMAAYFPVRHQIHHGVLTVPDRHIHAYSSTVYAVHLIPANRDSVISCVYSIFVVAANVELLWWNFDHEFKHTSSLYVGSYMWNYNTKKQSSERILK